jgi:hypothetical protein
MKERILAGDRRQDYWEQKREEVDHLADGLGNPIDEDIKESVVALRAHEFPTYASCDGHGSSGPWIQVEALAPEDWRESEAKQKEWQRENLRQRDRITELLNEFYRERQTPSDIRLALERHGIFGAFRIQSAGAEAIGDLSLSERQEKYRLYKKEMDDFTEFLRMKFFNGEAQ